MKSHKNDLRVDVEDYEVVAQEYYDGNQHPTCQNFNALSRRFIAAAISRGTDLSRVVELGCGDSSIAPLLHAQGHNMRSLILLDTSPRMLEYSQQWKGVGATLHLRDAHKTGEQDSSVSLVVAGLADPYNTEALWAEIARILRPGGQAIFTTPSFEWASAYRENEGSPQHQAAFLLRNGRLVYLPSYVYPLDVQVRLIQQFGLQLLRFEAFEAAAITDMTISPKIARVGESAPVLWGLLARKAFQL